MHEPCSAHSGAVAFASDRGRPGDEGRGVPTERPGALHGGDEPGRGSGGFVCPRRQRCEGDAAPGSLDGGGGRRLIKLAGDDHLWDPGPRHGRDSASAAVVDRYRCIAEVGGCQISYWAANCDQAYAVIGRGRSSRGGGAISRVGQWRRGTVR